jgi:hypothetical protein
MQMEDERTRFNTCVDRHSLNIHHPQNSLLRSSFLNKCRLARRASLEIDATSVLDRGGGDPFPSRFLSSLSCCS